MSLLTSLDSRGFTEAVCRITGGGPGNCCLEHFEHKDAVPPIMPLVRAKYRPDDGPRGLCGDLRETSSSSAEKLRIGIAPSRWLLVA